MENYEKIPENSENYDEKALEDFVKDLEQYDNDHGHGTWFGRSMSAMMMNSFESEDEKDEKINGDQKGLKNLRKKIEANKKIDDLISQHSLMLEKLGVELESPNKEGNIDEAETYAVGEIEIDLSNKDKYVAFLKKNKRRKHFTGARENSEYYWKKTCIPISNKIRPGRT